MTETQLKLFRYLKQNGTSTLTILREHVNVKGQNLPFWEDYLWKLSPTYVTKEADKVSITPEGEMLLQREEQAAVDKKYVEDLEFQKLQGEVHIIENTLKDYPKTKNQAHWAIIIAGAAVVIAVLQLVLQLTGVLKP